MNEIVNKFVKGAAGGGHPPSFKSKFERRLRENNVEISPFVSYDDHWHVLGSLACEHRELYEMTLREYYGN